MYKVIEDIRPQQLTVEMLDAMPPHTIFAHGYMEHIHPWFNNINDLRALGHLPLKVGEDEILQVPDSKYRLVKWVAVRGGVRDWAIYHSLGGNLCQEEYFDCDCHLLSTWHQLAHHGEKLHHMDEVRKWIPCTDDAFALYRH